MCSCTRKWKVHACGPNLNGRPLSGNVCTRIYSASNISTLNRFWHAWECYAYIYMPSLMDIQFIMQLLRIASYSLWIIRLIVTVAMGSWCESNPAFSHAIIYDVLQLLCTVALDLCYIAFSDYLLTSIAQSPTSSTTVKRETVACS